MKETENLYFDLNSDVFSLHESGLIWSYNHHTLLIEGWGENSLRVRATELPEIPQTTYALQTNCKKEAIIKIDATHASITNGAITAVISLEGTLSFYRQDGTLLLQEKAPNKNWQTGELEARKFIPISGGKHRLTVQFSSSNRNEKIYGMGICGEEPLNLKGFSLRLAPFDSTISIPYYISSVGYGFLWNNPSIGQAVFAYNTTTWSASVSSVMDYWITAGDTPAQLLEAYMCVSGKPPKFPERLTGCWTFNSFEDEAQIFAGEGSQTPPSSASVIKLSPTLFQKIVWDCDETLREKLRAYVQDLQSVGTEPIIAVRPEINVRTQPYEQAKRHGLLIKAERGLPYSLTSNYGNYSQLDVTAPKALSFFQHFIEKTIRSTDVKSLFLDGISPQYDRAHFEHYRYADGTGEEIANQLPNYSLSDFSAEQNTSDSHTPWLLTNAVWSGSQRHNVVFLIERDCLNFAHLKAQVSDGIRLGLSGIPWWAVHFKSTHKGNICNFESYELFARYLQYTAFCPVMCMESQYDSDDKNNPYQQKAQTLYRKYQQIREHFRSYLQEQAKSVQNGVPIVQSLFYAFPEDPMAWETEDEFLLGSDILVAPVLSAGAVSRIVRFPKGSLWKNYWNEEFYTGGSEVNVEAPVEQIPLFLRCDPKPASF